jgi:UDP:flavonoid glycosyltransferase YjiC (YdhE family)
LCDTKIVRAVSDIGELCAAKRVLAISTELPVEAPLGLPELILCPADLEVYPVPTGSTRLYCEPSLQEVAGVERGRRFRAFSGRVSVYCSFGTQVDEYPDAGRVLVEVVRAFSGRLDYQVVIVAGRRAGLLRKLAGPNVSIRTFVPQRSFLAQSDVAIIHGGLGTVKECIAARVPMVVIPFYSDQPANGTRVERLGLGRLCVPCAARMDVIRSLSREVASSPTMASAIRAMDRTLRRVEEAAPAARFVLRTVEM